MQEHRRVFPIWISSAPRSQMNAPERPAAPASGTTDPIPTFDELAADPDIAALLDFEPVPRSHGKANGWTAGMQRMFIAWLAYYGSPTKACDELGKARSGIDKVYKSDGADSFRASWDAAVALAEKRRIAALASRPGGAGALRAPVMSRAPLQRTDLDINGRPPQPGEVINERGEWEDEAQYLQRGEEAKDNIGMRLLRIRRAYLAEICRSRPSAPRSRSSPSCPLTGARPSGWSRSPTSPTEPPTSASPDMILAAEAVGRSARSATAPTRKRNCAQRSTRIARSGGWSRSRGRSEHRAQ